MIFLLALAAAVAPAPDPASIQSLYEVGECIATRSPQTAHLLQTAPASREEADAEDVLAPLLSDCLKKGAKLELNRPGMRSLLALAAYRIVTSPKGAAQ